ncbi:MAG: FAD-dependent oxidoreductase [Actinomycetota bacterium]
MESVEVAVVGAGVMGAATAWAFSKRTIDALVLEQFTLEHDRGSSHGATRVFRFAYDDPMYVSMAQRSLRLWRELEDSSKHALLTITGGIDFGSTEYLEDEAAALHSCGAEAHVLDPHALRERFPMIDYGSEYALYSPDTGVLDASQCLTDLLASASVRTQTKADSISIEDDSLVINGNIKATRAILTAGAWSGPLLASASISLPLQVTREQVFHFSSSETSPVVIDRLDVMRYVVPTPTGIKAGEHGTGIRCTADDRSFEVEPEGQKRITEWITQSFPSAGSNPQSAETCLYTLTPDEDFVIGSKGPLIYASPCSGHGFKFAPLIGEILCAMALDEPAPVDISRFSPTRF